MRRPPDFTANERTTAMCTRSAPRPSRRDLLAGVSLAAAALMLGFAPRAARADAAVVDLPKPGVSDTCPVCGMFVSKYPDWVATVVFADGKAEHFDGAKDFFKYLADVGKYTPGRKREDITAMGVTDYYTVQLIDPLDALFAMGSDVLGPMGHELIPLMTQADATDFMKDHAGKRLLVFAEVTPDMLTGLDQGKFE